MNWPQQAGLVLLGIAMAVAALVWVIRALAARGRRTDEL
jgi:predicted Kef-type K+ transport protein